MNAKYADVVKTSEVLAFLDTLPSGMYDLPKGKRLRRSASKNKNARRIFDKSACISHETSLRDQAGR